MSVSEGPEIRRLNEFQDGINIDLDNVVNNHGFMFWVSSIVSTFFRDFLLKNI